MDTSLSVPGDGNRYPARVRLMRFSLKQLLIGVALFSTFMMFAVLDGIGIAIVFAILSFFVGFTLYRLFNKWPQLRSAGRIYGVAIAIASTALLGAFFFLMATDATVSRYRTARAMQWSIENEPDFSGVTITYQETKIEYIAVSGSVNTRSDFDMLKKQVLARDWRGMDAIRWDLQIRDTGEIVYELDYEYESL